MSPATESTNGLVTVAGCIVVINFAATRDSFPGIWHLEVLVDGVLRAQAALLPWLKPLSALNLFSTLNTLASQASVTALQTSIPASVWDASERTLNGPLFK
jgi:hypothetical protein